MPNKRRYPLRARLTQAAYAAVLSNLGALERAHAAIVPVKPPTGRSSETIFLTLFDKVVTTLSILAGGLAIVFIIMYGIQYITAAGDMEKAKKARANIVNAVIGVIVFTAAYFIVHLALSIGGMLNGAFGG